MVRTLEALGGTLADRGLDFHIAIAGAAALLLTEGLDHPTQDVDVVAVAPSGTPLRSSQQLELPLDLVRAAEDVAAVMGLDRDWLNAGALGVLFDRLPEGYEDRLRPTRFGNLTVSVLGRQDLVRLKLWAAADEGPGSRHHVALVQMGLSAAEVDDAEAWVNGLSRGGAYPGIDDVLQAVRRSLR
ncbi:MAG: hypothetical protein ACRDUY_10615 [Nitriliruptorales bacterium]